MGWIATGAINHERQIGNRVYDSSCLEILAIAGTHHDAHVSSITTPCNENLVGIAEFFPNNLIQHVYNFFCVQSSDIAT